MGRSDTIRRLEMKKFILALVATLCFLVLSGSGRVIDTPELEARVGVVGVVGGGTGLKTATITIGADANSGYIGSGLHASWAAARGDTSGNSYSTFSIRMQLGHSGGNYWNNRNVFPFDVTALPNGAIIVSATLNAYCNNYASVGTPDENVYLTNGKQASCTAVADGDLGQPLSGGIELYADSPTAVTATGAYTWTLNAAGLAAIQASLASGCVKFNLMGADDYNDVAPTSDEYELIFDDWNDANEPYLTITYR
jgi:hypothetical protein